jgi:thiol-disulfide isomerase/thioredoxin
VVRSVALVAAVLVSLAGCGGGSPPPQRHGSMSQLSAAPKDARVCDHRVPADVCTRHHPDRIAQFKKAGDWCAEHGVPESQCYACHPDLSFEPLPEVPAGADLATIATQGEDVPTLEAHLVPGKVTIFDFYADWCAPCRKVDAHTFALLQRRTDVAVRKLDVVSWDTPLAGRYLGEVAKLPFVVVYGKDGKRIAAITGLDLAALDAAIADGGAR